MENTNKKKKFLPNKKNKNLIEEEPIYVMTIELDQGKSGNLPIFLNSNPEELSFNFCKQYNLDYSSMDFLKNQIIKFKNEFINNDNIFFTPTIEEVDEESTRQVNNNKLNKEIKKLNLENNKINNNNNIQINSNNNSKIITNNTNNTNNINNTNNNNIKNNIINNNKIQNRIINSQSNSKTNSQINSQINSPKKKFENFIFKKNTFNPEKMIRKNPNLKKNKTKKKTKKYIETNQNKKEIIPVEKPNKKFISLNKQKINPIEHTLFSYERFFNNLKEKMEKRKSRNKSFELNKIKKPNLSNNLNNQSFNLINNNIPTEIKSYQNNLKNNILTENNNVKAYNNNQSIKIKSLLKKSPNHNKIRNKIYKNIQRSTFTNTGERLYEKGIKMAELECRRIKELKDNLLNDKKEIYTFHPKINSNTTEILEESKKFRTNYKDDKSLLNYRDIIENKMKKLKDKYKKEDFSFIPNFNLKSLKMENKKNLSREERINRMYNSKDNIQKKLKRIEIEMYQDCSFKPEFTDYSKGSLINKSFDERQKIYLSKSQEKKNKLFQEANEPFDNKTGQELFTPLINENKNDSFNLSRRKDVFDYLYSYAEKYKMHKSKTQESLFNKKRSLSIDYSSNNIFNKKKYKTFEKIFNLFDSNNDGQITIHTMDISKVPKKIITILQPIIEEIKNSEEPIYKDDFIEGCYKLYKILNFDDKQIIMRFPDDENRIKRIKELTPNFPFKPKIDKNSEKISSYTMFLNSSINKTSEELKDSDSSYINYLKHALSHNSLS